MKCLWGEEMKCLWGKEMKCLWGKEMKCLWGKEMKWLRRVRGHAEFQSTNTRGYYRFVSQCSLLAFGPPGCRSLPCAVI
jgi:hypothetical protein